MEDNSRGFDLKATGRTRARTRTGGMRTTKRKIEYKCGDCGHVGWTIHSDAERIFRTFQDAEAERIREFARNLPT